MITSTHCWEEGNSKDVFNVYLIGLFIVSCFFLFLEVFVDQIYIGLLKRRHLELIVPEGQVFHNFTVWVNFLFMRHNVLLRVK